MDNLQTEGKSLTRRYKWLLIAFVIGFALGAVSLGVMTGTDCLENKYGTELIMLMDVTKAALLGGLFFGATFCAIILLVSWLKRLLFK